MVERILFFKPPGERTHDRFMHSQEEHAIIVQVPVEKVKHPVLQFLIEIDDHIPANDQIEFNQKEIRIFHKIQFLIHRF